MLLLKVVMEKYFKTPEISCTIKVYNPLEYSSNIHNVITNICLIACQSGLQLGHAKLNQVPYHCPHALSIATWNFIICI